ncbi:MAG TPA: methyltransferase domain-containing protein [Acidimicrobiales bacterium]|jgi:SAM-dependent methyltransferase|nr:methyltransferase domain-containing protein [Acidimicrobiales bacterium]
MRPSVIDFARDVAEAFQLASPLVEMGARAAEGQEHMNDMRPIFQATEHIGCDIQPGIGVDRIEDIHHLTFADESVGTIIALETLEHVADPVRAVQEMYRVLRPGGVLAISSLMFFPIHAHPWDYWRFTPEAFDLLLQPFESRLVIAQGFESLPEGIFGVGIKGPMENLTPERLPRTNSRSLTWGQGLPVDFGPIRMTVKQLWGYTIKYSAEGVKRKLARLVGHGTHAG